MAEASAFVCILETVPVLPIACLLVFTPVPAIIVEPLPFSMVEALPSPFDDRFGREAACSITLCVTASDSFALLTTLDVCVSLLSFTGVIRSKRLCLGDMFRVCPLGDATFLPLEGGINLGIVLSFVWQVTDGVDSRRSSFAAVTTLFCCLFLPTVAMKGLSPVKDNTEHNASLPLFLSFVNAFDCISLYTGGWK